MRQGWKWAVVLPGVAAVAAVLALSLPAPLDWRVTAGLVVLVGFLVAVAVLIVRDSAARGRSG
jgi:hypothetical protein